jgi:hypothetical protein
MWGLLRQNRKRAHGDLIQLTATVRLRKLYPDLTLDRVSLQELERRESRPEIEGRKILATIHNKKA